MCCGNMGDARVIYRGVCRVCNEPIRLGTGAFLDEQFYHQVCLQGMTPEEYLEDIYAREGESQAGTQAKPTAQRRAGEGG